jgi:hypothetical protein
MEYSGAGGKLIHEKNQKQKLSWHCPFKGTGAMRFDTKESRTKQIFEKVTLEKNAVTMPLTRQTYRAQISLSS